MCNDKADIIRKVCFIAIALLYRLHSCKICQILFDLTVAIGFSQRLSDRIEYTYSPVFDFFAAITVSKQQT